MSEPEWPSRHFEKDSLLDIILDRVPVYLALISKDLIIQYISKYFADWFGLTKENLIGQHIKEIINKKQTTQINSYIEKVLSGNTVDIDTVVNDRENTKFNIHVTYIPYFNHQKEVVSFVVFIKDTTAIKLATEEIRIKEQRTLNKSEELDRFFELTLDLLCIADTDGYFLKLNPEWQKTLGFNISDLLGKYFMDLIHPDDKASTYKALKDLMNNKSVINFINRYQCNDGTYRWIEWRSNSYNNRIFAAARDITQRIEYENAIESNQKLLKELNVTKDKLFSIIAHDLKSPFSAILGYTEYLQTCIKNNHLEDIDEITGNLMISAKSAYDLLENLLEWSRMQSGTFKFQSHPVLLNELIEHPVNLVQSIANSKKIKIEATYPNNIHVLADLNLTNTILRNLLTNAVKFSYQNSRVLLTSFLSDDEVILKITDFGIGIRPESLEKLFLPDVQESTLGTLNEKGTGLGLMICKDFIEKLDGKINVESEVGKGSTFTFTLPVYSYNPDFQ